VILDEPVVAATDWLLAGGLFAMGSRLRAGPRALFWGLAFVALVGGTRHGFRSSLPPFPLELAWRGALAVFGFSGWSLIREVGPLRWRRVWDAKLALYLAGVGVTGSFDFALVNFTLDAAAASFILFSSLPASRWFLSGSALMGAGAVLLGLRPPLGGFPPASVFHFVEFAGLFLWFRHFSARAANP